MNNNKLQPAFIGGVVLGLLSAIPFVNFFNLCCCAWAILGGALAAYLYIKKSATPASVGDGALLGVIAGGIGAIVYVVVGLPLGLLTGNAFSNMAVRFAERANPEQADIFRAQIEAMQNQSIGERLLTALPFTFIGMVLLVAFATIGGLIGVAILEKRKGNTGAPTPPPNYGGTTTGGYGGADYASPPPTASTAPPPVAPPNFNEPPTGSSGSSL
jgi:hypothetical protein